MISAVDVPGLPSAAERWPAEGNFPAAHCDPSRGGADRAMLTNR